MDQSSLHADGDQDSLFGSPPPSPARGRSPSQETIPGDEVGRMKAVPGMGVGGKNVGTIALPGSHMSCAELPADLPASSLSLPCPTSSHCLPSLGIAGTPIAVVASRSSTRSVPSSATSTARNTPSASATTRKRRTPKAKSLTSAPPVPPVTLPGPNEPAPPNLLRSQSSLLGLAGLVGCVKPAQLYTHSSQSTSVQQSRPHSPTRGSTPTHPIVLDDDQDTPHIGKHSCGQLRMPQHLVQLNPETLRSNVMKTLTREKNIFPVLESLIKLLGGEPHLPSGNPLPQPFARPYGHGIFNTQLPPFSAPSNSTTILPAPPPKRRKLKHVPAGAADWDVPFPFAAGEGPEAYRDTWAQDRAKQLVTQLLDLVQNATKKAAVKIAKNGGKTSRRWSRAQSSQSSRSASVETRVGQISSTQANVPEHTFSSPEGAMTGAPNIVTPTDSLTDCLGSLESPSTIDSPPPGSEDRVPVDSEQGAVEQGGSAVPCDYSAFEEWLSQLQQFVPLETNAPTPESDWSTCPLVPSDTLASSPAPDILAPKQRDASTSPRAIRDEAIDPALLAISQQTGSVPRSQSPTSLTSALAPGDVPQIPGISSTPPVLAHSPHTSLSSLAEPLTPSSTDVPTSTIVHQDLVYEPLATQPTEEECYSRAQNRVPTPVLPSPPTELSEPLHTTAAQKGKERADISVVAAAPSAPSRFTPKVVSTAKGALDKQVILERAWERRIELVAEIERAKKEIWETSIENAVLVHFMRDVPS